MSVVRSNSALTVPKLSLGKMSRKGGRLSQMQCPGDEFLFTLQWHHIHGPPAIQWYVIRRAKDAWISQFSAAFVSDACDRMSNAPDNVVFLHVYFVILSIGDSLTPQAGKFFHRGAIGPIGSAGSLGGNESNTCPGDMWVIVHHLSAYSCPSCLFFRTLLYFKTTTILV